MRRTRLAAATLAALLAVTGCSVLDRGPEPTPVGTGDRKAPAGQEELKPFYEQDLEWGACQGGECATLEVPVDYAAPTGETIEIAVFRAAAKSRGKRLGSLVVNPGGPGGSGVQYAQAADFIVSRQIRDRFDIVGFDPRGVGQSAPVDCVSDEALDDFLGEDPTPDDASEEQALLDAGAAFGKGCEEKTGALLRHVSTQDAARDMDVLRSALGDAKLTYLGKSYGTFLGATYAELFPERSGRLVLDGVVAPDLTGEEVTIGQAEGFDTATKAWAQSCLDDGDCPLGSTQDEVVQTVLDELEALDENPVDGAGGLTLTEGWATLGVARAMYDEGMWSMLTDAIVALRSGDGEPLGQLALDYADRNPDGRYTSNLMEAIYAVNCLDRPEEGTLADFRALEDRAEQAAPIWGRSLAWGGLACTEWPAEAKDQPRTIAAKGADPILVVGTTRDPATPYAWAQRLHEQLDDSALITHDGDGHTAYFRQNSCVDKAVDAYWLTGALPDGGALSC